MEPTNGINVTPTEETSSPEDCVTCVGLNEWIMAGFGLALAGVLIYMAVDVLTGSRVSSLVSGKVINGDITD